MIRLTELEYGASRVLVKIEGELTEGTLGLLAENLGEYRRGGLSEVCLQVDGVVSLDHRALQQHRPRFPADLRLVFHTSRLALQKALEGCGLEVVLTQNP